MPKVISYDEAMKQAAGTDCGLLLGNGFSIQHFNYKTLLEKLGLKADEPIRLLFDLLETVDFERVVKTLEDASIVETTTSCWARGLFVFNSSFARMNQSHRSAS